jgi:hypothetical protein
MRAFQLKHKKSSVEGDQANELFSDSLD